MYNITFVIKVDGFISSLDSIYGYEVDIDLGQSVNTVNGINTLNTISEQIDSKNIGPQVFTQGNSKMLRISGGFESPSRYLRSKDVDDNLIAFTVSVEQECLATLQFHCLSVVWMYEEKGDPYIQTKVDLQNVSHTLVFDNINSQPLSVSTDTSEVILSNEKLAQNVSLTLSDNSLKGEGERQYVINYYNDDSRITSTFQPYEDVVILKDTVTNDTTRVTVKCNEKNLTSGKVGDFIISSGTSVNSYKANLFFNVMPIADCKNCSEESLQSSVSVNYENIVSVNEKTKRSSGIFINNVFYEFEVLPLTQYVDVVLVDLLGRIIVEKSMAINERIQILNHSKQVSFLTVRSHQTIVKNEVIIP